MYLIRWIYPSAPGSRPAGHDWLVCSGIDSEETFVAAWTTRDKATPLTTAEAATVRGYWNEDSRHAIDVVELDAPTPPVGELARVVTGEEAITKAGLSPIGCAIMYVLPSSQGAPVDLDTIVYTVRSLSEDADTTTEEVRRELSSLAGLGLVMIDAPRRVDERNGWQLTERGDRLRTHFIHTVRKKHDVFRGLLPL